jgi:hypothetical protein
MGGLYDSYGPGRLSFDVENPFPVIKYSDTDNNGFIDQMEYDLDGDKIFEELISLKELGIDDVCPVIKTESLNYDGLCGLKEKLAEDMWQQALCAVKVASQSGLEIKWYALLMHPKSVRQKYHLGYWLQFYLYRDLLGLATMKNDESNIQKISKAYYSSDWKSLLNDK